MMLSNILMNSLQQQRVKARFLKERQDVMKYRKGGTYIGLTLGAMVVGIYFFSMYTIKQETILKEIDDEIENAND